MSVDEKQLDQLKQTLQADDYRMDVNLQGDSADVSIVAGPNACEECLVPKPLMQSMLGPVLGVDPAGMVVAYTPAPGDLSVDGGNEQSRRSRPASGGKAAGVVPVGHVTRRS